MGDNMRVVNVSRPSEGVKRFDCAIEIGHTTVGEVLVASGYISHENLERFSIQMNGVEVAATALAENNAKFVVTEKDPIPAPEASQEQESGDHEDESPTYGDEMDDDDDLDDEVVPSVPPPLTQEPGTPVQDGPGFVKIVCIPGTNFPVEVRPGDTVRSVLERSGKVRVSDVSNYEITIDKQPANLSTLVVAGNLVVMTDKISGA